MYTLLHLLDILFHGYRNPWDQNKEAVETPGVTILPSGQKFTTYGTLNFFVSGPILKLFFSAESWDPKGHVTKYSPL